MTRGGVAWAVLGLVLIGGCAGPAGGGGQPDAGAGADGGGQSDGGSPPSTPAPACTVVQGTRDLAIIPVTIGSDASPCTSSSIDTAWLSGTPDVAAFWHLASGGRIQVTGTIEGGVTISSPSGCIGSNAKQNLQLLGNTIGPAVDSKLSAQGVTIPSGTAHVYLLPGSVRCTGAKIAASTLPPKNETFFYGASCSNVTIDAHEVGHLLGLNHADSYGKNGQPIEYGDISDIMGHAPEPVPPNGPHRWQQGWVPTDRTITLASSVANLSLARLGDDTSSLPQLVRIVRPSDQTTAIWISYRVATGSDATLDPSFSGRTSIHTFVADCVAPGTMPVPKTYLLSTLGDGESYTVSGDNISVKQVSSDGNGAVVSITIP